MAYWFNSLRPKGNRLSSASKHVHTLVNQQTQRKQKVSTVVPHLSISQFERVTFNTTSVERESDCGNSRLSILSRQFYIKANEWKTIIVQEVLFFPNNLTQMWCNERIGDLVLYLHKYCFSVRPVKNTLTVILELTPSAQCKKLQWCWC